MWLIIASGILLAVGFWGTWKDFDSAFLSATSMMALTFGGICLSLLVASIPISRNDGREQMVKLQAFRETIQRARDNKSLQNLERSTIVVKIAEWNEWIAYTKYSNKGTWDWWHVDEVDAMEPIE